MNSPMETFHQIERHFFSLISTDLLLLQTLNACISEVPVSTLNPAFYLGDYHLLEADICKCKRFYKGYSTPWTLVVPEYLSNSQIINLLTRSGFHYIDQGVAMYLAVRDLEIPELESDLLVRRMDKDIGTWILPSIPAFDSTEEIAAIYRLRHQEAIQKSSEIYHFSGFIQDEIVSSLTLTIEGEGARIDDVATFPNYQNKGYATQLILSTLQVLKESNIPWCFLEASNVGLNIYKKIGFHELFKNHYYEEHDQYDQN